MATSAISNNPFNTPHGFYSYGGNYDLNKPEEVSKFLTTFCTQQQNYYFCLRLTSSAQGCTINSDFSVSYVGGFKGNTSLLINQGMETVSPNSVYQMVPIGTGSNPNQFMIQDSSGTKLDTAWYRKGPPARVNIMSGYGDSEAGTIQYYFIPDGRQDGSGNVMNNYLQGEFLYLNMNAPVQIGVVYNGPGNASGKQYGNLLSIYCEDGGTTEVCLQSHTPTLGRVATWVMTTIDVTFIPSPPPYTAPPTAYLNTYYYNVPISFLNYQDGCTAFACNYLNAQVKETYGGTSFNSYCLNYLGQILAATTGTRYTPDMFLTTWTSWTTAKVNNYCKEPSVNNLYSLMSQQCINYCNDPKYNTSCQVIRETFCANIMPFSNAVDDNYSTLCACFWPTEFYAARSQQSVDAISLLYPGLNSVLTELLTNNVEPQCSYAPCSVANNYILPTQTSQTCRPVNLCLQSINANIGSVTDTDLNIANSCVINDINSKGTPLSPAQQASVDAYNNGTINKPTSQTLFKKIIKSFGLLEAIAFISIIVIVIILIIILIIYIIKKKKLPKNAYMNRGGRLVKATV